MKIIIPIVGTNTLTNDSQYIRSLYEIEKKTILQYVYESLNRIKNAEFVVVMSQEDVLKYHMDDMVKLLIPDVKIVVAVGLTAGSACSCLLAIDEIDEDEPLIIAGGDQIVLENPQTVLEYFNEMNYDGGVIIFDDIHPRWSYVKIDDQELVTEAAEKRPISRNATTGFYYFKEGSDFIDAVQEMIIKNASVNEKYYVCPCYNEMILKHKKVGVYRITKQQYFNLNSQKGINEYEAYLQRRERI